MFEKLSLDKIPSSPVFDIKEVGTVKEVKRAVATIEGLPSCLYGQMVRFPHDLLGMIIGFDEKEVMALLFGDETELRSGDQVVSRAEPFRVAVGEHFLGRIVNALGQPRDGGPRIEPGDFHPVFRVAPGVMERIPVSDALETGTKIFDSIIPLAKGQRELIIGDRKTGKTTLGIDAILNQKGKDVLCIYCAIGQSQAMLDRIIQLLRDRGAMSYSILIVATSSDPAGEQFLAPYTAASMGEHFMGHGRDVLVIFDDLTKHAWVHRQISLLLERSPGREAYPGDVFYIHSSLLERAGRLRPELGGGTMTFLPIVETQQGDVTGHIPSNLISITDGQLYVSTALFNEGFKPAIDVGLSISRIGSKAQTEAMRELCGRLRLEYVQYRGLLKMTKIQSAINPETEAHLRRGAALTEIFMQDKNQPVPPEEEVVLFYALKSPSFEQLDAKSWKRVKAELFSHLTRLHPELVNQIRTGKRLTSELKAGLDEAFRSFHKEADSAKLQKDLEKVRDVRKMLKQLAKLEEGE